MPSPETDVRIKDLMPVKRTYASAEQIGFPSDEIDQAMRGTSSVLEAKALITRYADTLRREVAPEALKDEVHRQFKGFIFQAAPRNNPGYGAMESTRFFNSSLFIVRAIDLETDPNGTRSIEPQINPNNPDSYFDSLVPLARDHKIVNSQIQRPN
jgi:hypothetical protein